MDIFSYRSRYHNTEMVIVDGVETVGVWNQPSYLLERPSNSNISKFYVTSALEGRPDLIAQAAYGSAELDWAIIAFNNPTEIINWPKAGDMIDLVARELVYAEL